MSKQITAVEWLIEQLRQLAHNPSTHLGMGDIRVTQGMLDDFEEQAKEMEKQQMKGMYIEGSFAMMRKFDGKELVTADEYIFETYGSKGSDETKTDKI